MEQMKKCVDGENQGSHSERKEIYVWNEAKRWFESVQPCDLKQINYIPLFYLLEQSRGGNTPSIKLRCIS